MTAATLARTGQDINGRPARLQIADRSDAAGAAYWKTLEAPGMPDPESVLAALVAQIAELTRSIQGQAVTLATVAGDMKTLVSRADSSE